jgi:8-oxo-dGTP diphosphatase
MSFATILHSVNLFLAENLFYLLLGVLLINMLQRRQRKTTQKKRMATFYLGVLVLVWMIGSILIVHFELPDLLQLPLVGALVLVAWRFRDHTFPFRRTCAKCGSPLSGNRMLYHDSNLCESCEPGQEGAAGQA